MVRRSIKFRKRATRQSKEREVPVMKGERGKVKTEGGMHNIIHKIYVCTGVYLNRVFVSPPPQKKGFTEKYIDVHVKVS